MPCPHPQPGTRVDSTDRPARRAQIPEDGLICAFAIPEHECNREIRTAELATALSDPLVVTWVHVNLAHTGTLRWLTRSEWIPEALRDSAERHDERCRIEPAADGLFLVVNDLTFEHESDPTEVATLWAYATRGS